MSAPKMINAYNRPHPVTVEIQFDQAMMNNAALNDPATYSFNHGAYTTSVSILDSERVRLTVENLFGYSSFIITAQSGLKSAINEDLYTNITVSVSIDLPAEEINAISAGNGRLKSGRLAKKVYSDYNNWYIITESGLDIIDKKSLFNKGYVLQESGFNTIFVTEDKE
jgi:hypothetical protein